jgi:hypothetical protein
VGGYLGLDNFYKGFIYEVIIWTNTILSSDHTKGQCSLFTRCSGCDPADSGGTCSVCPPPADTSLPSKPSTCINDCGPDSATKFPDGGSCSNCTVDPLTCPTGACSSAGVCYDSDPFCKDSHPVASSGPGGAFVCYNGTDICETGKNWAVGVRKCITCHFTCATCYDETEAHCQTCVHGDAEVIE